MTSERKNSLKGLDAFQSKAMEILDGLANHPKTIVWGLGLLLAALGVGYGVRYAVDKKQKDRGAELAKIDLVYGDELKAYEKQRGEREKKRDALRAALPSAGKAPQAAEESPEIKALEAEIQTLKPDHKASAEQYKNYAAKHTDAAEGVVAGLKYASYAAEQGQLEEAQKALESLVPHVQKYTILSGQVYLLLMSVLEDRDQLDKALEYAEKFASVAQEDLKPKALVSKGQILLLKKDYAKAQEVLNKVLSEHESSMEADRARTLLALIPSQQ